MAHMSKPKLHKEDIAKCAKLKGHGCADKDIAAMLGVSRETFSRWRNNPKTDLQRQLAHALKKAEAESKDRLLQIILRSAMEDRTWQAAAWMLERKYPDEYARPEVQLQREAQRESTEQLLKGFEDVTISIREAAFRASGTDEQAG